MWKRKHTYTHAPRPKPKEREQPRRPNQMRATLRSMMLEERERDKKEWGGKALEFCRWPVYPPESVMVAGFPILRRACCRLGNEGRKRARQGGRQA